MIVRRGKAAQPAVREIPDPTVRCYALVDGRVEPAEQPGFQPIARADAGVGGVEVSTVFLGSAIDFGAGAVPKVFETALCDPGSAIRIIMRAATLAEALRIHAAAVASIRAARDRNDD